MSLRKCLREPIPEIEIAARRLNDAVNAHLRGERDVVEELLRQANDKVVWDWLDSVWGKKTIYNQARSILNSRPTIPKELRLRPRDATGETKRSIHRRDGFYCRFLQNSGHPGQHKNCYPKGISQRCPVGSNERYPTCGIPVHVGAI